MALIQKDYIEKVYAGWLGKLIGVRYGAPIEGWTYDRILKVYGEITDYLVEYKDFAADDDSNGPMFFLRALEDYTHTSKITAEQMGLTWLNYAPYEHGFYWWGGYGKSTEHTAYLNLRNGIKAPRSGSIEQNGTAVAEQIGGQIFIDTWGLVVPGNPKLAAEYAEKAASVSHGGNGIYGGMFIAACISSAFTEQDMDKIIKSGLSVIPSDCEYSRIVRDTMRFHADYPENWRSCFEYIRKSYGYHKYPGNCHIIPNSAVIILSLLYGEGDFSQTINTCNMCGWDTDCNVANVGTILGVRNGLEGIDYKRWRKPINDFFACSSVIGSLNIMDVPWCAAYIANLAYKIAGEEPPEEWRGIVTGKVPRFHFELSGSTHGFRVASDTGRSLEYELHHTTEAAASGRGSLKIVVKPVSGGNEVRIFHKTYYRPHDFHDSRYDPSFSPILYPGQRLSGSVMIPDFMKEVGALACLYVKDGNSDKYIESEKIDLVPGRWAQITFDIPFLEGACLEEAGIKLIPKSGRENTLVAYLDNVDFSGRPNYSINFEKERMEVWNSLHREVSQFTYHKGIWDLEDGALSGSCCDFGEAYSGSYDWDDYSFEATVIPILGEHHNINFRVQGAVRSYACGLSPQEKISLYKNNNGYTVLKDVEFHWEYNKKYRLKVEVRESNIRIFCNNVKLMEYTDLDMPYLRGQIGASIFGGSHCHYKDFRISSEHV